MKYIEELNIGDTFKYKDQVFLLTCDFKSNNFKLCYCLTNGQPLWLNATEMVDHQPIYTLDKDNNIIAVKNL